MRNRLSVFVKNAYFSIYSIYHSFVDFLAFYSEVLYNVQKCHNHVHYIE